MNLEENYSVITGTSNGINKVFLSNQRLSAVNKLISVIGI